MNVLVALSKLVAGRQNPRRVKPEREAHRKLVASIRAHGLLAPLVVHTVEDGKYQVIAGNRRLAALREVHRGEDAKVPCITKAVDGDAAASMSLAENFAREPMHPLDEAEAFSRLAREECKGVAMIAEEFGVSETYVRQRMKLAGLAEPVKAALRENQISLAIAEAFAAVPPERQEQLWQEVGGKPRHAQQVRSLIESEWISATNALFDVKLVDPAQVSQDLFGGSVLIQREVFLRFQREAMEAERARLVDEGWNEAVVCSHENAHDLLMGTDEPEREYDAPTTAKLLKLRAKRQKLEAKEPQSEAAEEKLIAELEEVDEEERKLLEENPGSYTEASKAAGTVFLVLSPDGRVERQHRVPRSPRGTKNGRGGQGNGADGDDAEDGGGTGPDALPTCDQLSPRQMAELYQHEALAVREAVSKDKLVRKRLMVLALHDRVRCDAIAIRKEVNGTRLHSEQSGQDKPDPSPLWGNQQGRRKEVDPLTDQQDWEETEAYAKIKDLTEKELDALIGVLVVESLTGHGHRSTRLLVVLRKELGVSLRTHWAPGAEWLAGYQKAQLADLIGKLRGPVHGTAALGRKKSELVTELAGVFGQTANAPMDASEKAVATKAWEWLPAPVREDGTTADPG